MKTLLLALLLGLLLTPRAQIASQPIIYVPYFGNGDVLTDQSAVFDFADLRLDRD